ncbi:MAG TPA: Fpg/Nei family DNA glycosylase [Candidatus Saccharibacteria bacterium]|nr:Fpg/Nei family DNA glycosylase [Candidatus Saccharibacteria bacterium]
MPELPEVETVKRGLEKLLIGHTILSIDFDWPKSFPNNPEDVRQFLVGAKVTGIRRRAKVLLIDLSSNYTLVIHLKMTGQLVYVRSSEQSHESRVTSHEEDMQTIYHNSKFIPHISVGVADTRFGAGHPNDSLISRLPDRSTRVEFTLDNDARLFFNDQRKFGWVRLYPTVEVPNIDFMKKVGPEPLEGDFTFSVFSSQLRKRKNSIIKAVLLDQTIIAGIGNIYADESLWGAKIHPETRVVDIPTSKLKKLHSEIIYVLELSIEKGGSTDRNYVNAEGKRGSYIDFARVFRKEGTPCSRCGTEIIKIRAAARGTHLCPKCQQST